MSTIAKSVDSKFVRMAIASLPLILVASIWATDFVRANNFVLNVNKVQLFSFLESSYTYFYLHIFTFVPVFLLSFDSRVHYYRKWKYLLPAVIIVAGVFIAWDVFFAEQQVWGFNERYLSGMFLFGLPLEEWLFFFTVPFACVFVYECLNYYIKADLLKSAEPYITPTLIVIFLIIGVLFWQHIYTSTTFLLSGFFLLFHYLFVNGAYRSRFYLAYFVIWIPFLLVNGVLTGGYTQEPIVIYNPEEYLGIRITSVPLDDSVYNFLMLMGIVTLFEYFRPNKTGQETPTNEVGS